jgi:hypothetical protein
LALLTLRAWAKHGGGGMVAYMANLGQQGTYLWCLRVTSRRLLPEDGVTKSGNRHTFKIGRVTFCQRVAWKRKGQRILCTEYGVRSIAAVATVPGIKLPVWLAAMAGVGLGG